MNLEQVRKYCADKPGSWEDFPFDEITLVLKVGSKMYALIATESNPLRISLKCDPLSAEGLRHKYAAITPGYHLNKKHWNTIEIDESISTKLLQNMIDESYELVFSKLKKIEKTEILKESRQ